MLDFLTDLDPGYYWLTLGIILIAFEALAPGIYLLWFGLAALAMAVIGFILPELTLLQQFGIFALLATASVVFAWRFLKVNPLKSDDNPNLNQRALQMIGQRITLETPLKAHKSEKIFIGDTVWTILSDTDMEAGLSVEISALSDSGAFIVKPCA